MIPRTGFALLAVGASLLVVAPAASRDAPVALPDRLADYMRGREADGFNGAVLVVRERDVLLRRGFGYADLELGVRNTPETVFRIGSVTKPLVATAVLRLIAHGRLGLDDPLVRFVPDVPAAWSRVTVRDLLSHTSGIPDLFDRVAAGPPGDLRALLDDTLRNARDAALESEPGSRYAYSNFGYLLLAYVLEVADDRPWLEVLQREVFSTAKLRATRYDDVWRIVPGRARGYERDGDAIVNTKYEDHGALSAGGLLSTVDDLHRFVAALEDGRLLPSGLRRSMHTPVRDHYALGLQITRFFDRPVVDHSGGIGGFSSHFAYYPDDRLFLAVLSNVEDAPVKAVACDLAAVVFGSHSTVLDRNPTPDPDRSWFDRLVGSYVGADGTAREVVRRGEDLELRRGSVTYSMIPIAFRTFTIEDLPGVVLRFDGPSAEPAASCTAIACGSALFTAVRRHDP